jgi:DNA-binding transcriptional MerR regulator
VFTIGPFARLSGISAKALRAYDAMHLFRPAWVDPESGYRRYSPAQLPEIRRIAALRAMGMGLEEIRGALEAGDLRGALARREAALERERVELERLLTQLQIRVEAGDIEHDGLDVVVRSVPRELVAMLDMTDVAGGDPETGFDELEAVVRDLGLRAHRPPGMLLEDWARPSGGSLFVPVRRPFPSTGRIRGVALPAIRAATILHRGGYGGLHARHGALVAWVDQAGLARSGPLRILYLQFGAAPGLRLPAAWLVDDASDYLTELQVPILA